MIEIRSQKSEFRSQESGVRIKELSKPLNVEMTASLSVKLFDTQFSKTLK